MEYQSDKQAMDKYLSPTDVWAMAFGVMVGWGVFVMPGTTFIPVAGPAGTVIAMFVGTLIVLVIGANIAYLMQRSSRTGGVYSYTKEAFGRDYAFLCSWFLCLSYLTIVFLNASALFIVVRTVFGNALQTGLQYSIAGNPVYFGEVTVTVLLLLGIGLLYMISKPALQHIHTVLSLILAAGIAAIALFCMPQAMASGVLRDFALGGMGSNAYGIFSIVILAPWAFVGFEVITFDTAHFAFDIKKSWKIILGSVLVAGMAYAAMAAVSVASVPDGFLSWREYMQSLNAQSGASAVPTFHAAAAILGEVGLALAAITAFAAILTGVIGGYRATTRVLSTMAEDRILSQKFSQTKYSILFIMALSIVISLLGRNTLNWFVNLTAFGAIVSFGFTSAAAYKSAKTEGNGLMMASGAAGFVISTIFAVVQIVPRLTAMEAMGSEAFLLLSLWCLLGFVFYWRTVTHSTLSEYSGISASGIVLFALLVYSAILWLGKLLAEKESVEDVRFFIVWGGIIALAIIFVGMIVMLYIQNLVRTKHEAIERDKVRAVESSLAKSQFLFNMSHDIRTPMNAIVGYTKLALKEQASAQVHSYLDKIGRSSQHLLMLINDILEMSRIESGKLNLEYAPEDLCAIFEGIRELFYEQMKQKNMDFSVHASQIRNRFVWCDKKNLNRILLNLLGNAFKFTKERGEISASIWEIGSENGYGSYEIRIRDNGIGMSQAFAEKMFTAFERERTSTVSGIEGTGLGLSITKSLVDMMGGSIEVLTTLGSGTEFIIRLKFKLADAADIKQADPSEHTEHQKNAVAFGGKRLLLVDDNAINLEIAQILLEQMGFAVDTAENGKIAVDKVAASAPGHYDAVLMDIQMPVMDGYEAAHAIRNLDDRALASIPIIAMTANAFAEDVRAAEEAGMQGHIAKPIDVDVMTATLLHVLDGQKA